MSSGKNQLVQASPEGHHIQSGFLTDDGQALLDRNPNQLAIFIEAGRAIAQSTHPFYDRWSDTDLAYMTSGMIGDLYELPEDSGLCMKVVSHYTGTAQFNDEDFRFVGLSPNLTVEAKFMYAVGKRLDKYPDSGVKAPRQYAAAKFAGGSALLQERIPEAYAPISQLMTNAHSGDERTQILNYGSRVARTTRRAMGLHMQRFAMRELGRGRGIHQENVLGNRQGLRESEALDAYVVDLASPGRFSQLVAAAVA
jgi:hypothetical protein